MQSEYQNFLSWYIEEEKYNFFICPFTEKILIKIEIDTEKWILIISLDAERKPKGKKVLYDDIESLQKYKGLNELV